MTEHKMTVDEQAQTLNALLATRQMVRVYLDPRDSHVPEEYRREPMIFVEIGLNMALPIPDLIVDRFGVAATLSFNRQPRPCLIPWRAVYALECEATRTQVVFRLPPNVRTQTQPKAADAPPAQVIDLAAYRARREASRAV